MQGDGNGHRVFSHRADICRGKKNRLIQTQNDFSLHLQLTFFFHPSPLNSAAIFFFFFTQSGSFCNFFSVKIFYFFPGLNLDGKQQTHPSICYRGCWRVSCRLSPCGEVTASQSAEGTRPSQSVSQSVSAPERNKTLVCLGLVGEERTRSTGGVRPTK